MTFVEIGTVGLGVGIVGLIIFAVWVFWDMDRRTKRLNKELDEDTQKIIEKWRREDRARLERNRKQNQELIEKEEITQSETVSQAGGEVKEKKQSTV